MDRITTAHTAEETEQNGKKAASKKAFPQIPNSAMVALMTGAAPPDDNLRGHRMDLAPILNAKMSAAFGMDLSGVKLYRSKAMAGTGIHGLARGNEIVLADDVDLNTLAGQTVLGLELSHIRAQSMGLGIGHTGLLHNTALEHTADIEGARAARGLDVVQRGMETGMGINTAFGMEGVEPLQPIGAGLGVSAAAPMQAKKDDLSLLDIENPGPEEHAAQGQPAQEQPVKDQPAPDQPAQSEKAQEDDILGSEPISRKNSEKYDPKEDNEKFGSMPLKMKNGKRIMPLTWEHPVSGDTSAPPQAYIHVRENESSKFTDVESGGHSYMSLEYSRYSKGRGGRRRFRTDFGFYPSFNSDKVGMIGVYGQGGTVPGKLLNENALDSDVSRKYEIDYEQAETIVDQASTYEEGGYNFVKRNCTTFVRDMAKAAGLPTQLPAKEGEKQDEDIFKEEKWNTETFDSLRTGAARFAGLFHKTNSGLDYLQAHKGKADLRYNANKSLVTEEDITRYVDSRKKGGIEYKGIAPGQTAERMRRSHAGALAGRATDKDGLEHFLRSVNQEALTSKLDQAYQDDTFEVSEAQQRDISAEIRPAAKEMIQIKNDYVAFCQFITAMVNARNRAREDTAEYLLKIGDLRERIQNWHAQYGTEYKRMDAVLGEWLGGITLCDDLIAAGNPHFGKGHEENVFSDLTKYNTKVTQMGTDMAMDTMHNKNNTTERQNALHDIPENQRTKQQQGELIKLSLRYKNTIAYKNEIYDRIDAQLERGTAEQEDLDFAFAEVPFLGGFYEKPAGAPSYYTVMNDGEFKSYSSAYQSGELRMLFGDKSDDELREFAKNTKGKSIPDAVHAETMQLMESEAVKMEMLAKSLIKSSTVYLTEMNKERPDDQKKSTRPSPQKLAIKLIAKVESMYMMPMLRKVYHTGKISASEKALVKQFNDSQSLPAELREAAENIIRRAMQE